MLSAGLGVCVWCEFRFVLRGRVIGEECGRDQHARARGKLRESGEQRKARAIEGRRGEEKEEE
jgi:hypothetical protein